MAPAAALDLEVEGAARGARRHEGAGGRREAGPAAGGEGVREQPGGQVDHAVEVAGGGRAVRVVDGVRDVLGVDPALEGPVQERVPHREADLPVRHRQVRDAGVREGHRSYQRPALVAPGVPHRAGRARGPEGLGPLLRRARAQRIRQAQRRRHEGVDGQQMADHAGDGRLAPDRSAAVEPRQPYRRPPLRLAHVAQQRVQSGGLRLVGRGPAGHRDARGAAGQGAGEDAGAQAGVEVEALLGVEQPDGVAQPHGLLRAGRAVGEVLLDGGGLLPGARGQRPRAEQGLQDGMRQRCRAHRRAAPPPGGATARGASCAVDNSCKPSRSLRRASSSVTPRRSAAWR